ncbi:hypothetical protein O9K51_03902 [Purpureocillium lavendulum]|uniref:Uncharacterized protein n=1 Tax=Purpureocillium lavendulum TaxID=1247861 RepID=A0AB34FWI9_9HYPO|nr:hypothetical protein O9K51_03902 [Purpureocillium lavendulum]
MYSKLAPVLVLVAASSAVAQGQNPPSSGLVLGLRHADGQCRSRNFSPITDSTCAELTGFLSVSINVPSNCTTYSAAACAGDGTLQQVGNQCYALTAWGSPASVSCVENLPPWGPQPQPQQ